MRLFGRSGHELGDGAVRNAMEKVKKLPESIILGDALEDDLVKIANQYAVKVAKLKPDQRRGKRRVEKRSVEEYGRSFEREYSMIDVSIPFDGEAESFSYAPSSSNILHERVELSEGALVVTFPDDEGLDKNVDSFILRVTANLELLEKELAHVPSTVLDTIRRVASDRRAEIEKRAALDKGRAFPIE